MISKQAVQLPESHSDALAQICQSIHVAPTEAKGANEHFGKSMPAAYKLPIHHLDTVLSSILASE